MEGSAPKRRRVSPDPEAPAPAPATTSAAAPAPVNLAPATASQSPSRRRRPSFASPTRASLSRYNPQILERRRSAVTSTPRATTTTTAPAPGIQTLTPVAARPRLGADGNIGAGVINQPADIPGQTGGAARPPTTSSQAGLTEPPRRTPTKPNPRPFPPPAPEGDDESNPFLGRMQRREPITGVPIPPPPEPELPPAVSDAVSSTPPRGIHSSPRWRDRDGHKKKSPMKSSPLKPRGLGTPTGRAGVSMSPATRSAMQRELPLQDRSLNANTNPARQVLASDKNIHKLKERNRLRREIAVLRREIELAARENERIRVMQRAGRIVAPENEEDVLNLVQKTLVATRTAPTPRLAHQMTQAALMPVGILPFGPSRLASNQGDPETDEANIRSHHPVPMSAADGLPFLQLFSPFSATSQVSVLPSAHNQPLRQRRQITLRSRDVPGLFTARVDMVVNAMNLNILALKVPALESCARPELRPFVDKICSGDCNRTMQHNVGILSWAMGEWYRVAVQRARFWFQLERSLAAKGDYLDAISRMRAEPGPGEDGSQDDELDTCDRADLFRFLGQQSYDVPVPTISEAGPESAVRLEWKIELDWTGEAQSKMGLFLGIPGKWRQADEGGVFGQFAKLLEVLIDGGQPPRKAVQTIVALLTGA
ncbi:uncharacterized protein MAM_00624 [Metarhizium album ARSEF 1941]|uniref:Uncharacterized protein n=1 Tax=Metarhizium album (strain ARSEF 1941) TaxID=1081103 RepID=A0A0B2X781_METAS|nr:uncharacterized protein MAM_00624 [Metarhizium album ARSEF 1941]KHO01623.1 hypothetical protein MAM_00624 [Metarhizium album ARSEF 1941]